MKERIQADHKKCWRKGKGALEVVVVVVVVFGTQFRLGMGTLLFCVFSTALSIGMFVQVSVTLMACQ